MILLHGRWRRRTALLALGALDGAEAESARVHVAGCAACARELDQTRAALDLVSTDPRRGAEPPIPLGALVARVQARLDETPSRTRSWRPLLAGAGLLAVVVAAMTAYSQRGPAPRVAASPQVASASAASADPGAAADSAAAMHRIETTLER